MVLNNCCAMKKYVSIFAMAVVAAAALVSCTKEIDNQDVIDNGVKMKTITVQTSIETKTTLDANHQNIVWSKGDKISIFNDIDDSNAEVAYVAGGSIEVEVPTTTTEIYAHYPYYSGNTSGPESVSIYIAKGQTQENPGELNGYYYPMVAKGTVSADNKALISLYPVAGALALNLYHTGLVGSESVSSVKVTVSNTGIVGSQSTDITGDDIQYTTPATDGPVTVTITNPLSLGSSKPANKQTFAGQIYVCLAKKSYSNVKFEIVTNKGLYTITSNSTAFDLENNDFVPVNIDLKKADFEGISVVDNTSSDYTTGFEESGFNVGTTYNNTTEKVDGPQGAMWASYYGTVSTNSALSGNNSMQLRWYTSATNNLGYARTDFILAKVGYVSFKAAATNGLKLGLYYKTGADWVLANTFDITASSDSYSHSFETALNNAQLKFQIVLPGTNPSSNSNLRIDDVVVKATAPAPDPTTISLSKGATSSDPIVVEVGSTVDLADYVTTNNAAGTKTFTTTVASTVATLSGSELTGVAATDDPFVVSLSIAASSGYAATAEPTSIYVKVVPAEILSNKVFTANDYSANSLTVTKSPITGVFAKGGGTSAPYVSSEHVRLYQNNSTHKGGTLTITSTSANIKKVVFTFDGNQTYLTSDAGTYSDGTWTTTTAVSSVEFYCNGSSSSERADVASFTVYYVSSGSEPEQLVMGTISCTDSGVNENSLTFSWDAVDGASGYQVSTDGGNTYGATQNGLTYTLDGLQAGTSHTIWVKAVGDGTNYLTSDGKESASGTTKASGGGDPVVLIIDGSLLSSTATSETTTKVYDGVNVVFSDGAKKQTSTGDNKFTASAILIGKTGKNIHATVPGTITKFEIYANKGASASVSVGVNFSSSAITSYNANAANTFKATLSTLDHIYDCSSSLPNNANSFWYQVTNSNNSQVEFRITYIPSN